MHFLNVDTSLYQIFKSTLTNVLPGMPLGRSVSIWKLSGSQWQTQFSKNPKAHLKAPVFFHWQQILSAVFLELTEIHF